MAFSWFFRGFFVAPLFRGQNLRVLALEESSEVSVTIVVAPHREGLTLQAIFARNQTCAWGFSECPPALGARNGRVHVHVLDYVGKNQP